MDYPALRIHQFMPVSHANGPGARAVLWVQGCSLGCPGCFNPETHPLDGGELVPVAGLFRQIAGFSSAIEGVSISGGEPLLQLRPLVSLLRRLREETALSSLVFTGYTLEEIRAMPGAEELLDCVDVLIAGRYARSQRLGSGLRGSANQIIHLLTARYTMEQIQRVPPSEIVITAAGDILISGIDTIRW